MLAVALEDATVPNTAATFTKVRSVSNIADAVAPLEGRIAKPVLKTGMGRRTLLLSTPAY